MIVTATNVITAGILSFDGTTNQPIVYPEGTTLAEIQREVFDQNGSVNKLSDSPGQVAPPKLVEPENKPKALGFNWTLGGVNFANGNLIGSGGTMPSLAPRQAASVSNGALAESSNSRNPADAPTIGTLTGIMTDPQFIVTTRALAQREGVAPLTPPTDYNFDGVTTSPNVGKLGTFAPVPAPSAEPRDDSSVAGGRVVASGGTQPSAGDATVILDPDGRQVEMLSAREVANKNADRVRQLSRGEAHQAEQFADSAKVPQLGDLPMAGRAFRSESGRQAKMKVDDLQTIVPQNAAQALSGGFTGVQSGVNSPIVNHAVIISPHEPDDRKDVETLGRKSEIALGLDLSPTLGKSNYQLDEAAKSAIKQKAESASRAPSTFGGGGGGGAVQGGSDEAIRGEYDKLVMRKKLQFAQDAEKQGDLTTASKLYGEVSVLADKINTSAGEQMGKVPNPEAAAKLPAFRANDLDVGTLVQEGKYYYEAGRVDEAEKKLTEALQKDPSSVAANYYLRLAKEKQMSDASRRSELESADALLQVEKSWDVEQRNGQLVPRPNAFNRTNLAGNDSRKKLDVTDSEPQSTATVPGATLEPMNVMHYNSIKIENEANLTNKEALLKRLKALSPEELRQTLPTLLPDPTLTSLLEGYVNSQARVSALLKDRGPEDPEVKQLQTAAVVFDQEINGRVNGIMKGLETDVETARAIVTNVAAKVEEARKNDAALAERLKKEAEAAEAAKAALNPPKPAASPLIPQPEVSTAENAFSTFSLNVADVAFKLAAASLEKGVMPDPSNIRTEEFINAFDYRDPEPGPGAPLAFAWERVRYPFAQNRDLLRFAVRTAAAGRQPGRPMNIVLLLDNSGSMERADRVAIIRQALRVLASKLEPQDRLSVVTFARTAHLRVDGVPGSQAAQVAEEIGGLTPQGGTNLEEAMRLAYETAQRHYLANGVNRVVLMTDGAANLGNVDPVALKEKVDANRKQGIALDCFGIGWEGYNDDLLETLSRNGDGRYRFINTPEEATTDFVGQLAGALNVAASDVKVQVEFNPKRVANYRQIGYAKHQLTKEQFRDNTVNAAQIAAAESGNALYTVEVNPAGEGPIAIVRVRYRVPGTQDYHEHEWAVPYQGNALGLEQASIAMRLAGAASAFAEWLGGSPFAAEVTPDRLLSYLNGVPEAFGADQRPKKLEWMIRQAKSLTGK